MKAFLSIFLRCLAAFLVGWAVGDLRYLTAIVWRETDSSSHLRDIGALTTGAATLTLVFVIISLVLGLVFLIRPVRELWSLIGNWAVIPSLIAAVIVLFSDDIYLPIWAGLYVLLLFPIVNWPRKKSENN
jgi:hypothetical protein